MAFRNNYVCSLGHTFPTLKEADAMFMAEKAPEWKEGDCCNRCRTKFGMVNRQVGYKLLKTIILIFL